MMRGIAVVLSHLSPGNFLHPDDPRMAAQWHGPVPAPEPPRFAHFDVEVLGRTEKMVKLIRIGTRNAAWFPQAEIELSPVVDLSGHARRAPRFNPGGMSTFYPVFQVTMPGALARQNGWRS